MCFYTLSADLYLLFFLRYFVSANEKIHRNVSKTPHVRINQVFFEPMGSLIKKEGSVCEKTSKDVEAGSAKTSGK